MLKHSRLILHGDAHVFKKSRKTKWPLMPSFPTPDNFHLGFT